MDLDVNRILINPSFEGYKLGASPLHYNVVPLSSPVAQVVPDEKNYFYLRLHEETSLNHLLHGDGSKSDGSSFFFIDDDRNVRQLTYKEGTTSTKVVFVIPRPEEIKGDKVTPTMAVLSNRLMAVSDGSGKLYIISSNTKEDVNGPRKFSSESDYVHSFGYPFYIHQGVEKNGQAHCLLLSFHDDEDSTEMHILIDWIMININFSAINASEKSLWCKTFKGYKSPSYISFSPNLDSLLLICGQEFVLLNADSGKTSSKRPDVEQQSDLGYMWSQSADLVSVKFSLPLKVSKSDIYCHLTHSSIDLYLHGSTLLKGKLCCDVVADASRWIFDANELELILVKKDTEKEWSSIVVGDNRGRRNRDEELEDKTTELQQRLQHYTSEEIVTDANTTREPSFNMQQLEECDENLDDTKLYCIDIDNGSYMHEINLADRQWLFNEASGNSAASSVCLRHDVDGILWEPTTSPSTNKWSWEHRATFNALGYIQASKTEHRFTVSGLNHDVYAISDCDRRIFIYLQGELESKDGKQYVVTLPQQESILGMRASRDHVFVLTTTQFYAIKVT